MDLEPSTPKYNTGDRKSFAYQTARDRWPIILTAAIDDLHRSVIDADTPQKRNEGKKIIEELAKLKYEIQHDRRLTPIVNDGKPDVAAYNNELEQLGSPSWFNACWLFAECYLYRRMNSLFAASQYWKDYDVFYRQKMSSFGYSRKAVIELASRYKSLVEEIEEQKSNAKSIRPQDQAEAEKMLFTELCEFCLWGNATDLSLLTNLSYSDVQALQGSEARKSAEKNILVNDIGAAFEALMLAKDSDEESKKKRCVHVVLDNAGFELYVDLVFAGYLIAAGYATEVVLHPKEIPWFVSDATTTDFEALLEALNNPTSAFASSSSNETSEAKDSTLSQEECGVLSYLYHRLSTLRGEGKITIQENSFWHQPGSHWRMPKTAPQLFEGFKQSELVVFKGDLHYRKLTADAMWPTTTSFADSLGPLGVKSGIRVLALRTCKADVVVGLKEGEDDRLRDTKDGGGDSGARKWAWTGKWAVAQFCDGT